jgi:hypothetical protein
LFCRIQFTEEAAMAPKHITLNQIEHERFLAQLRGLPDPHPVVDRSEMKRAAAAAMEDYQYCRGPRWTQEHLGQMRDFSDAYINEYIKRYALAVRGIHT